MKVLSVSDQNVSMDLIDYCYPGKTSSSGNYFKNTLNFQDPEEGTKHMFFSRRRAPQT